MGLVFISSQSGSSTCSFSLWEGIKPQMERNGAEPEVQNRCGAGHVARILRYLEQFVYVYGL